MPGAEKWKVLTQDLDLCWICDQQIATIVFYSRELIELRDPLPQPIQDYYNQMTECEPQLQPTVQAQYTNWRPSRLRELSELCIALSGNPPTDWLEKMHDSQRCRPELTSLD
jgi:hypothetical protein